MRLSVSAYKASVEKFAESLLGDYVARLKARNGAVAPKEVNDSLWQTVALSAMEAVVLDSPLLQRLRHVTQLGVAHWIYPSARHSRFEHSLGALHQMQRVLLRLDLKSIGIPDWAKVENGLRLAALLHDVGHGCMSHVVENAYDARARSLMLDLQDELALSDEPQLSEAAAYFLVGSPACRQLLQEAHRLSGHPPIPEDLGTWLQKAIVASVLDERLPLIQELISGPFDVDKLDYMSRDAMHCGIPVVVDIPRLVQKIRLQLLARDQVPDRVLQTVNEQRVYWVQGIALSGARTLDELMLGRTLLFDKVYRHHKLRAAEAMVALMLEPLASIIGSDALLLPLRLHDGQLLEFERGALNHALGREITDTEWDSLSSARELAQLLRERLLFRRAYAFASTMPNDPFRDDPTQRLAIEQLERAVAKPEGRLALIGEIRRQLAAVSVALGEPPPPDHHFSLDPPRPKGSSSAIARAYLISEDGGLRRFRDDSAESPFWSNAYLMTRDIGYVFSAEAIAERVFLATEAALWSKFSLRTPASASIYAKVRQGELDRLRAHLTMAGYYAGSLDVLRATPERLKKADIKGKIEGVVRRLGTFEGTPFSKAEPGLRTSKVTYERVFMWLKQFGSDEYIESALDLLERIEVVSRADVRSALESFVTSHSDFEGAYLCAFGGPKDSSSIVTYFAQDCSALGLRVVSVPEALAVDENAPIIFVDDFIGSCGQADTIVKGWFGLQGTVDENHGAPLGASAQENLKKRRVAFLFLRGLKEGIENLRTIITDLGLQGLAHIHDQHVPEAFVEGSLFKERCREIGSSLLESYGDKQRDENWRSERALGYGNKGYLLAFPYNVPTQTLTLLWCEGRVGGAPWLPLLPRRKKI